MSTFIHGIAATEHIDSSGERVSIDGLDISSLDKDGVFNYEHDGGEKAIKVPLQVVGKILECKKIKSPKDCENTHHLIFWKRVQKPFVYVAGELFDDEGHPGSIAVAAMLNYDEKKKHEKKVVNFSIEGAKLLKEGMDVKRSIGRKVSITVHPCNKVCEAEKMNVGNEKTEDKEDFKASDFFKSEEDFGVEIEIREKGGALDRLDDMIAKSEGDVLGNLLVLRDELALAKANASFNKLLVKKAWGKSEKVMSDLKKEYKVERLNIIKKTPETVELMCKSDVILSMKITPKLEELFRLAKKSMPTGSPDQIKLLAGAVALNMMKKNEKKAASICQEIDRHFKKVG